MSDGEMVEVIKVWFNWRRSVLDSREHYRRKELPPAIIEIDATLSTESIDATTDRRVRNREVVRDTFSRR